MRNTNSRSRSSRSRRNTSWYSRRYFAKRLAQPPATAFALLGFALVIGYLFHVFAASNAAVVTSYNQTILADHPAAFWGMNSTTATEHDLTGHAHKGTYTGGKPPLVKMLNGSKASDFNGSSEYMTVASARGFSIPTTGQLTFEGWIRPATLQYPNSTASGYIDWAGKCANFAPNCEWEERMYSSVNSENRCNGISTYAFNPSAGFGSGSRWQPVCGLLQAGQWLMVDGEFQTKTTPSGCDPTYPGTILTWVNGVPSHTGCMSQFMVKPVAGNSPLNVGSMVGRYFFKGAIGKVAIYNYLLSQTQINSHFKAMTGVAPSGSCPTTCTIPVPTP